MFLKYFVRSLENQLLKTCSAPTRLHRRLKSTRRYPGSPTPQKTPRHWTINPRTMETSDWLKIGDKYRVCPWSVSGVESSIVVSCESFTVAFDMGYAYPAAVKCQHVFISHGHMDHVSAVVSHASKRRLYSMPPATYYVPPHLVTPLESLAKTFSDMHEAPIKLKLQAVDIDETVPLSRTSGVFVQAFPTMHRVQSQGYILYKKNKKLKPEHEGKPSHQIGSLIREGEDVHDVTTTPLVAYTGDTISDIFDSPHNPDLLRVELLITEATYVDNENQGGCTVQKARDRGHCHLDELVDKHRQFENVKDIVLVHFSDKYSARYIREQIANKVPEHFKAKLHVGLVFKDKFEVR